MDKLHYKGKGEHSVIELELIIEQQAEELHLLNSGQKQLNMHDVSNCGDYAKNRPDGIKNDEWWCPNCNEVVPSFDVTNDERHGIDGCMTKVC